MTWQYFPEHRKRNRAREIHQRIMRQRMHGRSDRTAWFRQCEWCGELFQPGWTPNTRWYDRCCCIEHHRAWRLVEQTIADVISLERKRSGRDDGRKWRWRR